MENGVVNVLMVNYNHVDVIAESIESVLKQSYKNIPFVIIDD